MGSKVELTPCKECRHSALLRQDDVGWYVRCEVDFCNNCTGYFDTPEEASRVWNQRQEGGTVSISDKPILDACCGGKMMYFDKHDPRVLSQDIRKVPRHKIESNGSYFEVSPDVVGDFRKMDFPSNSFSMVIFDPPHLKCGETSFMFYKYGSLGATWENDLRLGFAECFRVLKPNGTLIFKWCDSFRSLKYVLELAPEKPVISHKTISRSGSKYTYFVVFIKSSQSKGETK